MVRPYGGTFPWTCKSCTDEVRDQRATVTDAEDDDMDVQDDEDHDQQATAAESEDDDDDDRDVQDITTYEIVEKVSRFTDLITFYFCTWLTQSCFL